MDKQNDNIISYNHIVYEEYDQGGCQETPSVSVLFFYVTSDMSTYRMSALLCIAAQ